MNRNVQIKNPKKLSKRANPKSKTTMIKEFTQRGPNRAAVSLSTFPQLAQKPTMDRKEIADPEQRAMNPEPGLARVPISYCKDRPQIPIPVPRRTRDAQLS